MITGPTLIIGGLALLALLLYPLRRWAAAVVVAGAAIGGVLTLIMVSFPLDRVVLIGERTVLLSQPVTFLGYALSVTEAERPVLVMMGIIALVACAGSWLQRSEAAFIPTGLLILALWIMIVTVRPPVGALPILAIASCLAVFTFARSPRAAFRQMWWPLIAYPLATIAAWHAVEANFQLDDITHMQTAARLMGLALLILLAPTPLHVPAVSLLAEAPPIVGAFLILGGELALLHLTWAVFAQWPWLVENVDVSRVLAIGGLTTLLWGAMGALSADRVQRLWAYAALHDWGVFLLGFSLGSPLEWRMATALFLSRAISIFLSAYGIASLRSRVPEDDWPSVQGRMRRLPWTALAIMVGGLGLAGFPLTASFAPRWALIQTLLLTEPAWALLIVAGQMGVALGYLQLLQVLLAPAAPGQRFVRREAPIGVALLGAGVLLSGILAIAPQLTDGTVQTIVGIIQSLSQAP
jgi:formate hydrogenlyase subunit 3/multisubunit Na+/H+ antiporter MnhD subunit